MHKYLLLRDNKQSGPYTTREIIDKGLKPYDLVWLEGRSAAWRYPSEIDELKAHAPAVEEQPFDRFYRKDEPARPESVHPADAAALTAGTAIASENPAAPVLQTGNGRKDKTEHPDGRFQPPAIPMHSAEVSAKGGSRNVHVDYPSPAAVATLPAATAAPVSPVQPEEIALPQTTPAQPERYTLRKRTNKKTVYGAWAACGLMAVCLGALISNYNSQRRSIHELNTLLQQMDREKQPSSVVPAALIDNTSEPAGPSSPLSPAEPPVEEGPVINEYPKAERKPEAGKNSYGETNQPPLTNARPQNVSSRTARDEEVDKTAVKAVTPSNTAGAATERNIFDLVSVRPNNYKTGVLGGISHLQLELANTSGRQLQNVAVLIKYLGPEKRVVRRETVYFQNVLPGQQAVLDVPKSSRGVTVDCLITDIRY